MDTALRSGRPGAAGGADRRGPPAQKARPGSTRLRLHPPAARAWPAEVQTFAFDLDDDLAKLVTIRPLPSGLVIEVQYGREYVLRHDRYMLPLAGSPSIRRTAFGVSVVTTRPLLGRLQLQQSYRF